MVDYTPLVQQWPSNTTRLEALLAGRRLLFGFGDPALLHLLAGQALQLAAAVTAVSSGRDVQERMAQQRPQLVVLSDRLEDGDGTVVARWLKSQHRDVPVLLLVSQPHRWQAIERAVRAGCEGIVLQRHVGSGAVIKALEVMARGGIYVDPALQDPRAQRGGHGAPLQPLTEREVEVLQAVVDGLNTEQIAARLFIAPDTVKTHLRNLLRKLGVRDRTAAAVRGLQWGLVDVPDEG